MTTSDCTSHTLRVYWIRRVAQSTHLSKGRFLEIFSAQRGTQPSRCVEACLLNLVILFHKQVTSQIVIDWALKCLAAQDVLGQESFVKARIIHENKRTHTSVNCFSHFLSLFLSLSVSFFQKPQTDVELCPHSSKPAVLRMRWPRHSGSPTVGNSHDSFGGERRHCTSQVQSAPCGQADRCVQERTSHHAVIARTDVQKKVFETEAQEGEARLQERRRRLPCESRASHSSDVFFPNEGLLNQSI